MFSIIRNTVFSILFAFVIGTNAYAQDSTFSLTDELILSIDKSCTFLSIDTSYPSKDYMSIGSYPEVSSVIDSGTFMQIVKNYPATPPKRVSILRNFKRIKLIDAKQIDSLYTHQKGSYKYATISLPVFNDNKQYALIEYSRFHADGASGIIWLLKKINNKWVAMVSVGGWIACG